MTKALSTKWPRRYRWIFILIAVVLLGQLLLAYLLPMLTNNIINHDSGNKSPGTPLAHDTTRATAATTRLQTPTEPKSAATLRTGEVTVSADCTINTKEAISAIHRAQTSSCKQHIADITCAIQAGQFYAQSLPNSCPSGSFLAKRALGCFRDEKGSRLLVGYYTNFKQLNSPGKCIQLCLQSGFLYAGVQYGSECFCGNAEPPAAAKLNATADADSNECNYPCVGDADQMCGGYFAMNVYETGISKFVPQVAELQPRNATAESSVRIVFLLTLNGRAVRQVHRLLRALYSPQHYYYIHVDERQNYLYSQLLPLESRAHNIRLARRRYSTIWGGASLLSMLLASMADLRQWPDWRWDFVINLSESDFPVKTVHRLTEFLTANRDRNFVKSHGREVQRFIQKQGLDKTFIECDTHMWRTGDRQLPAGIQIDGGSDWVALSKPFVEYVSAGAVGDELIDGLLQLFRHTLLPAESFFHTALRNSRFCNTYVDNNLHVTNWKRKLGCKCQYKHVVDWCGCSPNDFRPDDWPRLLATETKQVFFARKFEPVVNQAVIAKLETWLFGQAHVIDVANLRSYWQNVYATTADDAKPHEDEHTRALLAVAQSVVRLHLQRPQRLSHMLGDSMGDNIRVDQVNIYMDNDEHRGFLVRAFVRPLVNADDSHSSVTSSDGVELEVWSRPEQQPQVSRKQPVGKRIIHLEVSSDFDPKEQIARNFLRILDTRSEPVLVMHFADASATAKAAGPPAVGASPGTATNQTPATFNCTCLWINPAGRLEDVSEMHVEESAHGFSVHHTKPKLTLPLIAGVWTTVVLFQRNVVGKCQFFVVPSSAANDEASDALQRSLLDDEQLVRRTHSETVAWQQFLPSAVERDQQLAAAVQIANSSAAERKQWLDTIVKRFMVLREVCLVDGNAEQQQCNETSWSSLAPDPKSDIYADLMTMAPTPLPT